MKVIMWMVHPCLWMAEWPYIRNSQQAV